MRITVTGTRGIPSVMGGVETHCEELCPRIALRGAEVTLIRRSTYVRDGLTEWKGVKLVDIPSPGKKSLEAFVHTFRAVIFAKRHHADIVHINAIGPALLVPFAKILGLKVVFTHHGMDYDRDKWGSIAKTALRYGERMGVKYSDEVIVISEVIRSHIEKKYGRTKGVHLIPNGVPAPEICTYEEYFNSLGIEKGRYILGMSRFVPEKRLADLVDAFVMLRRDGRIAPDMKLVIAGDADFETSDVRSFREHAKEAGAVLTGFVKGRKLHSLLSGAACYVLPSSHEGLPIALLEAMSYSLPVVVSSIPANLEVGLQEKCYFKTADVGDLASHIDSTLRECRNAEYDMSRYSWDSIADEVMEVYESAMRL